MTILQLIANSLDQSP